MGTSAYDVVIQNRNKPKSAYDVVMQNKNSDDEHLTEGEDQDNTNGSFGGYLLGALKFLGKRMTLNPDLGKENYRAGEAYAKSIGNFVEDTGNTIKDTYNYYRNVSGSQFVNDLGSIGSDINQSLGNVATEGGGNLLAGMAKGLVDQFISQPIQFATATTNDNGVARPATVEEQTRNLEGIAGTVAQLATYKAINARMLFKPSTLDEGLQVLNSSKLGLIGKRAAQEAFSGGVSGGVQGAISGMGQDDQGERIIAQAITFAPLNAAFGVLGIPRELKETKQFVGKRINIETRAAAQDIAALNTLRVVGENPDIGKLLANVDALSSSDNLIEAAVKARLKVNDGYIIEGLSPDKVLEIANQYSPAITKDAPAYEASGLLKSKNPTYKGTQIKFASDLDKAAYILQNTKSKSKNYSKYLDEVMNKTGLSKAEIISHGNAVKAAIKNQVEGNGLTQRTQAEIEALEREFQQKGQSKLQQMSEGDSFQDASGKTWMKQGEAITDGQVILPIDLEATQKIAGRPKNFNNLQSFVSLDAVKFQPEFGREVNPKGLNVYHSPTTNSTIVTPIKFKDDVIGFFERNGFLRNEIVNYNGRDYLVKDSNKDGILLREAGTNNEITANPKDVRRTNNSLITSVVKQYETQGVPDNIKNIAPRKDLKDSGIPTTIRYLGMEDGRHVISLEHPNITQREIDLPEKIQSLNDLKNEIFKSQASEQRRNPNGVLLKDFPPDFEPKPVLQTSFNAGRLTPESFVDNLYQEFKNVYDNAPEDRPFADIFNGFLNDRKLNPNDSDWLKSSFIGKLHEDITRDIPELTDLANNIKNDIIDLQKSLDARLSDRIYNAAEANNLFVDTEGAGKYRVRYREDGKTLGVFGNHQEVLDAINGVRQISGPELDGGTTGNVPSGIGMVPGAYLQHYEIKTNKLGDILDASNLGGVMSKIVPVGRWIASLDNVTQGKTRFLADFFLPMQDALMKRQLFARSQPMVDLLDRANPLIKRLRNLDPERAGMILDAIETKTIDEIEKGLLARPLNNLEKTTAQTLFKKFKTEPAQVSRLFWDTHELAGNDVSFGSDTFMNALNDVAKKYDEGTVNAAKALVILSKHPTEEFSVYGTLRAADAYAHPSRNLTKEDFFSDNKFNGEEIQLTKALDSWFQSAAKVAGIDPKAIISGYIPHIKTFSTVSSFGKNSPINPVFARELSRLGITPKGDLIRDPSELIKAYYRATLNTKSGFLDQLANAQKALETNIKNLPPELDVNAISQKLNQHLNDVRGIPHIDNRLSKMSTELLKRLGLQTPEVNSVLELFSLSNIALRPALALRDAVNAYMISFNSFGRKFANEAFALSVPDQLVKELQDKGEIPKMTSTSLIDPSSHDIPFIRDSKYGDVLKKATESGFKLSGQEVVYNKSYAGVYRATMRMVERGLKQLKDSEIDKTEFYHQIGLSNHGPVIQREFDLLLSAGKDAEAAQFLAKWNARYVVNTFGYYNNPIGWNSNFGRLLGQYGSWSANAFQTWLETMSRGTKKDIAVRAARMGLSAAALATVGKMFGFNMHTWQVGNPFSIMPGVGPVINNYDTLREYAARFGEDPIDGTITAVKGFSQEFIPYRAFVRDWVNAVNNASNPIEFIGQGTGIRLQDR